nr:MarR family transcriptional regulator [Chelativorans sp. YIM 93263]
MASEILVLEDFLPYRLNRLADAISRDFSKIYRDRYGLNRPEWRTLATLGQYGTMTATEIGAHSAMHKTKVSRAVVALAKRGWLKREADPSDRRVEHLTLTRNGISAYRALVPLASAYGEKLLAALAPEDQAKLSEGLRALEQALSGKCNRLVSRSARDTASAAATNGAKAQAK